MAPPRPKRAAPAKKTAGGAFVALLWRQALFAIPFALFFGTLYGRRFEHYVQSYGLALVFTYVIGLGLWVCEWVVLPRIDRRHGATAAKFPGVLEGALFTGTSLLCTAIAGLIVNFTIFPMFNDARGILMFVMFSLLFSGLAMGIAYAVHFYRSAVEKARSDEEYRVANRIQRSFLISEFPAPGALDVHAVNLPSRHVSGDFYDVVPVGDGALLLALADVAGKGIPAALLTSMLQSSLRTQAPMVAAVSEILRNINTLVYRTSATHQFATFFLARVEAETLRVSYSNAGHNYPALFRARGPRALLDKGGVVVGILAEARFEEEGLVLAPGDRLVLYSDGVTEAENAAGEFFGEERLYACVEGLPPELTAKEITERILGDVQSFLAGTEPGDDITLLVLRVRGA